MDIEKRLEAIGKSLRLPLRQHDEADLQDAYKGGVITLISRMQSHMRLTCRILFGEVKKAPSEYGPAWVGLPTVLPIYGTVAFERLLIPLYIQRSFIQSAPLPMLVYAVAHELSHIVLNSTYSPFRQCEQSTDLCAMMLGYEHMIVRGYKNMLEQRQVKKKPWWRWPLFTTTETTSSFVPLQLGYLRQGEYEHAAKYIEILRKRT